MNFSFNLRVSLMINITFTSTTKGISLNPLGLVNKGNWSFIHQNHHSMYQFFARDASLGTKNRRFPARRRFKIESFIIRKCYPDHIASKKVEPSIEKPLHDQKTDKKKEDRGKEGDLGRRGRGEGEGEKSSVMAVGEGRSGERRAEEGGLVGAESREEDAVFHGRLLPRCLSLFDFGVGLREQEFQGKVGLRSRFLFGGWKPGTYEWSHRR